MRTIGLVLCLAAAAAAALAACKKDESAAPPEVDTTLQAPPTAKDPMPPGVMVAKIAGTALDVSLVKSSDPPVKEGDDVLVRGRIGGDSPFVEGRAAMTIVDAKLTPCNEMTTMEDGCKTPWDYCCSPKETIAEASATVQVVGKDGQALRHDLRLEGLKPLWTVVVKGKAAAGSSPKTLIVNAQEIWVEKKVDAPKTR